tara:strand:- start:1001 stop:1576 length:576 start_codon:yes stop_codon:yes gene_type:complete
MNKVNVAIVVENYTAMAEQIVGQVAKATIKHLANNDLDGELVAGRTDLIEISAGGPVVMKMIVYATNLDTFVTRPTQIGCGIDMTIAADMDASEDDPELSVGAFTNNLADHGFGGAYEIDRGPLDWPNSTDEIEYVASALAKWAAALAQAQMSEVSEIVMYWMEGGEGIPGIDDQGNPIADDEDDAWFDDD